MTWTKLGDEFTDETWVLSDSAARLLVDLHVWSNRKLLDCRVPLVDVERASRAHAALDELLAGGWCATDGETVAIRYHAVYQRTREQVLNQQQANKANRAKGKTRPVRERFQPDESSDRSTDEMVGSGRDRKNAPTEEQLGIRVLNECAFPGCTSQARNALRTCWTHAKFEEVA